MPFVAGFFAFALRAVPAEDQASNQPASNPSVAELLGNDARQKLGKTLETTKLDGKSYSWQQYVEWGKELYFHGSIKEPPIGAKPSKLLSEFYKCAHCHNYRREDRQLTVQNPESRLWWLEEVNKKSAKDELPVWLAPGTTLWGAVNRESFYNESYELYYDLKTVGDKEMDPKKLEDAIQICCRYCSVGRFAEPWELNSLLAFLWELEVRLSDLDLPKNIAALTMETLKNPATQDPIVVRQTREFIRRQFLLKAGETTIAPPTKSEKATSGPYPDKLVFEGDVMSGKKLYGLACANCHGKNKPSEIEGAALVRDLKRFHKVLSVGTEQDDQPYMPRFTSQRMSRQQIADIQAFLTSDSK